jgi:hypothetical protein
MCLFFDFDIKIVCLNVSKELLRKKYSYRAIHTYACRKCWLFFFSSVSCISIYTRVHIGSSPGTVWIGSFCHFIGEIEQIFVRLEWILLSQLIWRSYFSSFSSQEVQIWKTGKRFFLLIRSRVISVIHRHCLMHISCVLNHTQVTWSGKYRNIENFNTYVA